MRWLIVRAFWVLACCVVASAEQPLGDHVYPSQVMAEVRHYRLFLPAGYETSKVSYPVIYYFHGHSDRYPLEAYDKGLDTVPKISHFVHTHRVAVVAPDGYVAQDYTGFYAGSPYDLRRQGGRFDFGT